MTIPIAERASIRTVIEPPNLVDPEVKYWAYDPSDAEARYDKLTKQLSSTELDRLAHQDEVEALTAHLAEIEKIEAAPYNLQLFDQKLASVVIIDADNRTEKIAVVRFLTDMLASRVRKHPDDDRAQAVLAAFTTIIEPTITAMHYGSHLVFFSPSNTSNYEGQYGFMYVLKKSYNSNLGLEELEGIAVKLDLIPDEYSVLLNHHSNSYADIVNQVSVYSPDEFSHSPHLIQSILQPIRGNDRGEINLFGRSITDIDQWLKQETSRYNAIKSRIEPDAEQYIEYILSGHRTAAWQRIKSLQSATLKQTDPLIWAEAIRQANNSQNGTAEVWLGCGLMEIDSGLANPVEKIIRGLKGDSETCYCPACRADREVICGHCKVCNKKLN